MPGLASLRAIGTAKLLYLDFLSKMAGFRSFKGVYLRPFVVYLEKILSYSFSARMIIDSGKEVYGADMGELGAFYKGSFIGGTLEKAILIKASNYSSADANSAALDIQCSIIMALDAASASFFGSLKPHEIERQYQLSEYFNVTDERRPVKPNAWSGFFVEHFAKGYGEHLECVFMGPQNIFAVLKDAKDAGVLRDALSRSRGIYLEGMDNGTVAPCLIPPCIVTRDMMKAIFSDLTRDSINLFGIDQSSYMEQLPIHVMEEIMLVFGGFYNLIRYRMLFQHEGEKRLAKMKEIIISLTDLRLFFGKRLLMNPATTPKLRLKEYLKYFGEEAPSKLLTQLEDGSTEEKPLYSALKHLTLELRPLLEEAIAERSGRSSVRGSVIPK